MPNHAPVFYNADKLKTEESIGYLMRQVMSSIRTQADTRLAAHDLTYAQWLPLYKLSLEPGHTVATLAKDLETDPPAITRALDRLQAKGLVQRERSRQDRRVVRPRLTNEGRQVAGVVPDVLSQIYNGHLSDFSTAEWQTLLQLLRRMVANGEALRASFSDGKS